MLDGLVGGCHGSVLGRLHVLFVLSHDLDLLVDELFGVGLVLSLEDSFLLLHVCLHFILTRALFSLGSLALLELALGFAQVVLEGLRCVLLLF